MKHALEEAVEEDGSSGDVGNYADGSICRIKLSNFLTYNDAEFRPGPRLNVLIGPNGSGKSSIVGAIVLGLGGKPAVLGRAKTLAAFVKEQSARDTATIEIELFSNEGRNVVITRTISRDNKSEYMINGKASPESKVLAEVAKLKIQVGNLCQFLPQDKVGSFAMMNAKELLAASQESMGDGQLKVKHDELIRIGKATQEKRVQLQKFSDHLKSLRQQQEVLAPEYERWKTRQEQAVTLDLLKQKLAWTEYMEARETYVQSKAEKDRLKQEIKNERKKNEPMLKEFEDANKKYNETRDRWNNAKRVVNEVNTEINNLQRRCKKFQEDMDDEIEAVNEHSSHLHRCEKTEAVLDATIRGIQDEIEKLKREENVDVTAKLKEATAEKRKISDQLLDVLSDIKEAESQNRRHANDTKMMNEEITRLENTAAQRFELLRRKGEGPNAKKEDRDLYSAKRWLDANSDKFKEEVFGPVFMLLDVRKENDLGMVETSIPRRDITAFVTQNQEDSVTFQTNMKKQGLQVSVSAVDMSKQYEKPRFTPSELGSGFKGSIDDLFTCPAPVKHQLNFVQKLNHIPVFASEKERSERAEEMFTKFGVRTTMSTTVRSVTSKSPYGDRNIFSQDIDTNAHASPIDLQSIYRIHELQQQMQRKKEEMSKLSDGFEHNKVREKRLRNQVEEVSKRIDELKEVGNKEKRLEAKLNSEKRRKKQNKADIEAASQDLKQSSGSVKKKIVIRASDVIKLKDRVLKLMSENSRSQLLALESSALCDQAVARLAAVEEVEKRVRELEKDFEEAKERANNDRDTAREYKRKAEEITMKLTPRTQATKGEIDETLKQAFDTLPAELSKLREMTESEQARLDCGADVDMDAIKMFEKNRDQITIDQKEVDKMDAELETENAKVSGKVARWKPELEAGIQKISNEFYEFMSRLGCAGEVALDQPESDAEKYDFDRYGILIRVRFREGEELQQLKGERQSGGERSVSTMLYLMALQQLSKAPFRCVDEINQGMDASNERKVWSQVVHCSEKHKSQYFLVTPKLLPNLKFSRTMRVLTVFSGKFINPTHWFGTGTGDGKDSTCSGKVRSNQRPHKPYSITTVRDVIESRRAKRAIATGK